MDVVLQKDLFERSREVFSDSADKFSIKYHLTDVLDEEVEELLKEQNDDVKQFEYSSTLRNITFTIKLDKIGKIVVATLILDYSNTNDTLLGAAGNIPNFPSDFKCSKPKMLGGGSSIKSIGGAGITYAGNLEQLSDGNVKLTVSSLPETISGDTDNRQTSCSWIYVID